jgi:integrase
MTIRALTQRRLETLKPDVVRREIPDGLLPGLYLTTQPTGGKSWSVRFRVNGTPKKLTLGSWPAVSLAKARELARDAMLAATPAREHKAARDRAEAAAVNTFRNIAEAYLTREGQKLRTLAVRKDLLKRLVYPRLGSKQIDDVHRGDIVALLDQVEDECGPRQADVVLALVGRITRWHAVRDKNFCSPLVGGLSRYSPKEHKRTRILNDDELRALWRACETTPGQFSSLIRFLLLSAARRNEAAGMRWTEIDGDGWLLPAARNKVKVDLLRPLSRAAKAVLDELPRTEGCDYAFSADGKHPFANFSRPKALLDAESGVVNWRLHDLRRTSRSLMSRAGVPSDHAERALGYILPGVRGVYDRHRYHNEMLAAYEKLAMQIELILHPTDNVLQLRTNRS